MSSPIQEDMHVKPDLMTTAQSAINSARKEEARIVEEYNTASKNYLSASAGAEATTQGEVDGKFNEAHQLWEQAVAKLEQAVADARDNAVATDRTNSQRYNT
jgi:hypothetical protein